MIIMINLSKSVYHFGDYFHRYVSYISSFCRVVKTFFFELLLPDECTFLSAILKFLIFNSAILKFFDF